MEQRGRYATAFLTDFELTRLKANYDKFAHNNLHIQYLDRALKREVVWELFRSRIPWKYKDWKKMAIEFDNIKRMFKAIGKYGENSGNSGKHWKNKNMTTMPTTYKIIVKIKIK